MRFKSWKVHMIRSGSRYVQERSQALHYINHAGAGQTQRTKAQIKTPEPTRTLPWTLPKGEQSNSPLKTIKLHPFILCLQSMQMPRVWSSPGIRPVNRWALWGKQVFVFNSAPIRSKTERLPSFIFHKQHWSFSNQNKTRYRDEGAGRLQTRNQNMKT